MDRDINSPECFGDLPSDKQRALRFWIADTIKRSSKPSKQSSYGMKHYFEKADGGFYVTNGEFKGAMLAAGYQPTVRTRKDMNWKFYCTMDWNLPW